MSRSPRLGLAGTLAQAFIGSRLTPLLVTGSVLLGVVAIWALRQAICGWHSWARQKFNTASPRQCISPSKMNRSPTRTRLTLPWLGSSDATESFSTVWATFTCYRR